MKVLILLCLVAFASARPNEVNTKTVLTKAVSDSLLEVLESLRELMRTGNDDIPILDPFNMEEFSISFNADDMLAADVYATGVHLTGVSDFIANAIRVSIIPMGLAFDFTIPHVVLTTDYYKMNGKLFGAIPIYGEGKAHFEVEDFNVSGFFGIRIATAGLSIRSFDMELNLGKVKSETTGMIGGGDIDNVINAVINDLAAEFFNAYSDLIAERIEEFVVPVVDGILEGWTLQDLLDLINGSNNRVITLKDLQKKH